MARGQITPQSVVRTGVQLTETAADRTNGHSFVNTGKEVIVVNNGGGSQRTVTIDNPMVVDGLNVPDLTVAVAAGQIEAIGPFGKNYQQDDTTQTSTVEDCILVDFDSDTSVTISVLSLPAAY